MINEGFSRQLGRLDKQLRRMEDLLAPPKQSEFSRRLLERIEAGKRRAAEYREREGLGPPPEPAPLVRPPRVRPGSLEEIPARINSGSTRGAREERKHDAGTG